MPGSTAWLCLHIQTCSVFSLASCSYFITCLEIKKGCFSDLLWQFLNPAFPLYMMHFLCLLRAQLLLSQFSGHDFCPAWQSVPAYQTELSYPALTHLENAVCRRGIPVALHSMHVSSIFLQEPEILQSTSSKLITKSDLTLRGVIVNMASRRMLMTRIILFSSSSVLWIDPKSPNESKKRILREKVCLRSKSKLQYLSCCNKNSLIYFLPSGFPFKEKNRFQGKESLPPNVSIKP